MWDKAVELHGPSQCFGTRKVISLTKEVQTDGRTFEKIELGPYQWQTYDKVQQLVCTVIQGLQHIGQQAYERVLIYSDTREEFSIALLACFKGNFPVVTVYTNLGTDALEYSIKECKPTTIFTTSKLLKTVLVTLKDDHSVKNIVYFSQPDLPVDSGAPFSGKSCHYRIILYDELLRIGNRIGENPTCDVKPDDVALIMYTSGSTAAPKGVVLVHKNLVTSVKAHVERFGFRSTDRYLGYLPLAHMFEICAELTVFTRGCKIGFSSPLTLFDGAPGLKKGQLSDCSLFKPTFFAGTPAIYNRIVQAVNDSVSKRAPWKQELFRSVYDYLDRRHDKGYTDSLLGRLVFHQIRKITGGKVQLLFTAGAPMNPETQRFIKICFGCPFMQGFGSTETGGSGMVCWRNCLRTDDVGPPEIGCDVMLRDWKEGGYSSNNSVPQGEILIGGENVAQGYLNNEAQTKEAFFELHGKRWFATGDIGEIYPDGSFRIIDRKKDLVKLAQGEYISLGKVEAYLAVIPIIENICVYGNQLKDYVIALIVPRKENLCSLATSIGVFEQDFAKLCQNTVIKEEVLKEIQEYCKGKLHKMETPQKIHLCPDTWTPNEGLVTGAFKIKRKCIEKKYETEIRALYKE